MAWRCAKVVLDDHSSLTFIPPKDPVLSWMLDVRATGLGGPLLAHCWRMYHHRCGSGPPRGSHPSIGASSWHRGRCRWTFRAVPPRPHDLSKRALAAEIGILGEPSARDRCWSTIRWHPDQAMTASPRVQPTAGLGRRRCSRHEGDPTAGSTCGANSTAITADGTGSRCVGHCAEGTLIRLQADQLLGDRGPKPVWLHCSRTGFLLARWTDWRPCATSTSSTPSACSNRSTPNPDHSR